MLYYSYSLISKKRTIIFLRFLGVFKVFNSIRVFSIGYRDLKAYLVFCRSLGIFGEPVNLLFNIVILLEK